MIVNSISYNYAKNYEFPYNTNFVGRGKPITLNYVLKNRKHYLPKRVAEEAMCELNKGSKKSLLEIHKHVYSQLLDCETLKQATEIFPEFKTIDTSYSYINNCNSSRAFGNQSTEEFALKMLKEFWGKLRNKDDVAKEMGFKSRSNLNWVLDNINFSAPTSAYKALLKASDPEMNKIIASKTAAWNAAHPDLMYAHNKHAAQFCKTDEYRCAQAERMRERNANHPEIAEGAKEFSDTMWATPSGQIVSQALSEFTSQAPDYVRCIIKKTVQKMPLSDFEKRIIGSYRKKFWIAHPELRPVLKDAAKEARIILGKPPKNDN